MNSTAGNYFLKEKELEERMTLSTQWSQQIWTVPKTINNMRTVCNTVYY